MSMKKNPPAELDSALSFKAVENIEDFKINDVESYPNKLTCYLKLKIIDRLNVKGTGCLIGPRYLITAAHNVANVDSFLKSKVGNESYESRFIVKQAMRDHNPKCCFKVIDWRIAKKFDGNKREDINFDYALLIIQPQNKEQMETETKFMPILAMDPETLKKVEELQLYGYPVQVNKDIAAHKVNLDQSSFWMSDMFGATGMKYQKQQSDKKQVSIDYGIKYLLPTDAGISGGAIVTNYRQEGPVIIGVHKGTNKQKGQNPMSPSKQGESVHKGYNVGVNSKQMLEQFNEWGYELQRRPFIYTERTLPLRENDKLVKSQILFLLNKSLQKEDILVITAFELKHVKSITLTGNHIKREGFQYLTRRQYPNLQSLFVTDNQIQNLQKLPQKNWKNISTVKTLGLSVNSLISLPKQIVLLQNIHKLWVTYNKLTEIPQSLCELCEKAKSDPIIYLYKNGIKKSNNDPMQNRLTNTKSSIIFQKQSR